MDRRAAGAAGLQGCRRRCGFVSAAGAVHVRYAAAILPSGPSPLAPPGARAGISASWWLVAFVALAIAWTWPLAAHVTSRIPHDPGDSVLNIWLLWWNAHAVPFSAAWWSPPILLSDGGRARALRAPRRVGDRHDAAAMDRGMPAHGVQRRLHPVVRVVRLLRVPPRATPAVPPTIARRSATSRRSRLRLVYGFGPYRAGQLAHLQVLTSQWMPLALLAMHAYVEDGRRRWLALLSAAWLVQALSNGYYLLFFPVLIAAWLLWRGVHPDRSRPAVVAGVWVAASLLLVPVLLRYVGRAPAPRSCSDSR